MRVQSGRRILTPRVSRPSCRLCVIRHLTMFLLAPVPIPVPTLMPCLANLTGRWSRDLRRELARSQSLTSTMDLSKWVHSEVRMFTRCRRRAGQPRCPCSGCHLKVKNMHYGNVTGTNSLPRAARNCDLFIRCLSCEKNPNQKDMLREMLACRAVIVIVSHSTSESM